MLRTLLLVIASIWISGCQSYNARLNLPAKLERIQVKEIRSNNQLDSDIITDSIIAELTQHYIITDDNPDLIITGSVEMRQYYGVFGAPFITYALITLETPRGLAGTIHSKEGWFGADGPHKFAKKITKILTKRR